MTAGPAALPRPLHPQSPAVLLPCMVTGSCGDLLLARPGFWDLVRHRQGARVTSGAGGSRGMAAFSTRLAPARRGSPSPREAGGYLAPKVKESPRGGAAIAGLVPRGLTEGVSSFPAVFCGHGCCDAIMQVCLQQGECERPNACLC